MQHTRRETRKNGGTGGGPQSSRTVSSRKFTEMSNRKPSKRGGGSGGGGRRSKFNRRRVDSDRPAPSSVTSLTSAETYRTQLLKDIRLAIAQIQNAAQPEAVIRDLNDTINNLIKERQEWDKKIKQLNGPDYTQESDLELKTQVITIDGYHYFGAAKLLPGIKELFEKKHFAYERKLTTDQMYIGLDDSYFGFNSDLHPDQLLEKEAQCEEKWFNTIHSSQPSSADQSSEQLWNQLVAIEHNTKRRHRRRRTNNHDKREDNQDLGDWESLSLLHISPQDIPSQKQVQEAILEAKKKEIIERYSREIE